MELVTGATSSLLPKLGVLLQDEYQLQDKVRKDIESLQNELMFMNATLRVVAEVPRDQLDEHVRIWAVIIKDVSYDMEDVVSIFVARVQGAPHLDSLITRFFNMFCMGRTHHQMASMVEEIKSLIKEVGEQRDRYRIDNIVTMPATAVVLPQRENTLTRHLAADCEELTRRHIGIQCEDLVGLKEHMGVLHYWITSGNKNMVCIHGASGVGKTTIAMALYQNHWDQFQRRAIVNVSQKSGNVVQVLIEILSQFKPRELQDHGGDFVRITRELSECLQGKRLLILLEDMCFSTTSDDRALRWALPSSCRVIVTTWSDAVAKTYKENTSDCVHEVGLLSDENAEQLFMKVVGKQDMKAIPTRLWQICGGLPLAIVIMAGLIACNPEKSYDEWGEICAALPPSPSTNPTAYQLTRILGTCYIDLPLEIKTCSLYLSIFPRGQKISRKRLTRRWISDGFVIEQQGLSAEEVAEAYLNHLLRRKLLRAVDHSSNGKVKSYQVHDMVLEYIVSKASEENFVTTIGGRVMPPTSRKIRRLSIQCSGSEYEKELEIMNLSHVRDMTMFGSMKQLPSSSYKFGVVQILDLEGCKDFKQHHSKEICRMLLLKYLSLRRTDITKLTERIGDLQYLETLDIRETDIIELPKAICKLERVVNIFGGNKRTRMALKLPQELGRRKKMKALRILSGIEISDEAAAVADLHHLTDLRKLVIYKLNSSSGSWVSHHLGSSIKHLDGLSLHTLVIHDESSQFFKYIGDLSFYPKCLNALELSDNLVELPKWIAEMDALTKPTLSVTALRADNLELLSKICSLFSLTFSLSAAKQNEEIAAITENNKAWSDGVILFPVGGFENVKLLRFFAPYVPQLSFPDGALPTLERLDLQFSNFEGLVGIKGLKNLQEVHIRLHDETSEATKSIVQEMATAAREDREGPRIIFD